jgi:hypothetical protein
MSAMPSSRRADVADPATLPELKRSASAAGESRRHGSAQASPSLTAAGGTTRRNGLIGTSAASAGDAK